MSGANKDKPNFYQSIIHRVFSPMRLGHLVMELPDGRRLHYGAPQDSDIKARIRVVRPEFFRKCVLFGDIGFGEAYVNGDWETDDLTAVVAWMILNVEDHPTLMADKKKMAPVNFLKVLNRLLHQFRANTETGSQKNIRAHYDLSNDFFKLFLDPTMTYSSAYFKNPEMHLEQAQLTKYEVLCQKLRLEARDYLLEVGSGWGGFACYAAKNYGCRVKTITISQAQHDYVAAKIKHERLEEQVHVCLADYRSVQGHFDKIISIEMIEAVGHKFLATYFRKLQGLLKKDGVLALQMILSPDHRYDSFRRNVDWIQKHIFPGSLLPSLAAVQKAINKTGELCLFDYEDISMNYAKTLALWRNNFNHHLEHIRRLGFDEAFIRKWNYYFSYCEAAFKMRNISVVQAVYSRPNNHHLI